MPSSWKGGKGCACPGTQCCPGGAKCCGGALGLSSRNRGYLTKPVAAAEGLPRKRLLLCWWCGDEEDRARQARKPHTAATRRAIAEARTTAECRAQLRRQRTAAPSVNAPQPAEPPPGASQPGPASLQPPAAAQPPVALEQRQDASPAQNLPGSGSSAPLCPAGLQRLQAALALKLQTTQKPSATEILQAVGVQEPEGKHFAALRALLVVYQTGREVTGVDLGQGNFQERTRKLVDDWAAKGSGQLPSLCVTWSSEASAILNNVSRRAAFDPAFRSRYAAALLTDAAKLASF